jgi:hypothetical protein
MTRNQGFAAAASAAVVAAVALGFLEAGSPGVQRLRHADEVRLRDLNAIGAAVSDYFVVNKKLPSSLDEIQLQPGVSWRDPETLAPYEYRMVDEERFELCAVFATDNRKQDGPPQERAHSAGRECFVYR